MLLSCRLVHLVVLYRSAMWAEHTAKKFVTTAFISCFALFEQQPITTQCGWYKIQYKVSGHYRSHASFNLRYALDSDDELLIIANPAVLIRSVHFPNCRHCFWHVLRSAELTIPVYFRQADLFIASLLVMQASKLLNRCRPRPSRHTYEAS
jgi:hypothetical protein